jgi:hypothetical protein
MDNRERADLVMQAIGHAIDRNPEATSAVMDQIGYSSDAYAMYGVCCALAEAGRQIMPKILGEQPPDAVWGLLPLGDKPLETEPDRAFSVRFLTAYLNTDKDTCWALFFAAWKAGADDFTRSVITLLCDVADLARLALEMLEGSEGQ